MATGEAYYLNTYAEGNRALGWEEGEVRRGGRVRPPGFGRRAAPLRRRRRHAADGDAAGRPLLLKKFKQAYRSLDVEVEGDQLDDWPHSFTAIRIRFVIGWEPGFTPDPELVDKALDMACNRYCPVDATLTRGAPIAHTRADA